MNVVFLSPHFPPQYYRFCRSLKAAGANVLGIGDEPYDNLSPDVRNALTEYFRVDDLHSYEDLLRACGFFTHRYGKIDRLDSLNEYWLSTEARLRDDFNIAGIRGSEIDSIRRKFRMKSKFREAGVAVARGRLVPTSRCGDQSMVQAIFGMGFPNVDTLLSLKILDANYVTVDEFMYEGDDSPTCVKCRIKLQDEIARA